MLKLLSYLRALFLLVFLPLWTIVYSLIVILQLLLGVKKEVIGRGLSQIWSRVILFLSGVEVQIFGLENIPKNSGFLYVFNHTSHLDIPVIFFSSTKYCNFGAKSELFAIPIFGHAIRMSGALEIERSNREKVLRIYKEAATRVSQGEAFALAPEGTRKEGFGALGDFKSGPFYFAVHSKMPLVPVVIAGCEKVMGKESIFVNWGHWKQKVIFEVLPPILPDFEKSEEQIPELKNKVYGVMKMSLDKWWSQPF